MYTGKRGMVLEKAIEYTNKMYRHKGLALVDKVPTPWNVSYDKRTGRVYRAFPERKSTVDFMGISHGRAIAFEAKSTKIRTRFPLDKIQQHQMDYLLEHKDQGGISFFLVFFEKLGEAYFLKVEQAQEWWEASMEGGRKSIPYDWFVMNCDLIRANNGVPLNYLEFCKINQNKGERTSI